MFQSEIMKFIIQELAALGFSPDSIVSIFTLVVLYIIFIRKFDKIDNQIELIKRDISHIKESLNNHITDLKAGQNKLEIELKARQDRLETEFKTRQDELKAGQNKLETEFKARQDKLETEFKTRQDKLETEFKTRQDKLETELKAKQDELKAGQNKLAGKFDKLMIALFSNKVDLSKKQLPLDKDKL